MVYFQKIPQKCESSLLVRKKDKHEAPLENHHDKKNVNPFEKETKFKFNFKISE